jgi:O-antigen/teichoic acid export membrane protein
MLKQMLGYIPVNVANIVISFGTIALLTRLLSGEEFGRYALAMVSLQFGHMAAFSWIEAGISRFYARAERTGELATHLKTSYITAVILSIIGLPVFFAVIYFLPLDDTRMKMLLAYALGSTCLTIIYNIGIESHKAAHRIGRYSALHSSQSLFGFSVGIVLILMTDLREVAPFVGIILANILAIAIDFPFMLKKMKSGKLDQDLVRRYFAYGMPICLSLILSYILSQGDLFFIKYFMGDLAVGQYNAGYNLANRSLDVLFIWIAMAVTPIAITTLEKEGLEKTKDVLRNYAGILLLFILPTATGIALVAEPAGFILGQSVRAEAVKIMPWIAFAGVMNGFIAYYAQRAFVLSQRTGMLATTMVLPVLINIGLNIWLIPLYGLKGAIWATLVAYGVGLVLSLIVARRYFPLPLPFIALIKVGFACLVMTGIVLSLPQSLANLPDIAELLIKASVGALVYGFTVFATNAAHCRELITDMVRTYKERTASKQVSTQ